jgi:5'-nucleotidase
MHTSPTFPEPVIITIASSALFDLSGGQQVFDQDGQEAYRQYQRDHESAPLPAGPALPFVQRLMEVDDALGGGAIEIALVSRNDPDTGLRVRLSCDHHGLRLGRMGFTGGQPVWPVLRAFGSQLFLSRDRTSVVEAMGQGFAAGEVLAGAHGGSDRPGLRIAFDFDGIIADDVSERIYAEGGLTAFHAHEADAAAIPAGPGPLMALLRGLSRIHAALDRIGRSDLMRIAIMTARSAPADRRVVTTLRAWGLHVDEAYFLGHHPKDPVLAEFRPHLFFDDRRTNAAGACRAGPAVHVPFGIVNAAPPSQDSMPGPEVPRPGGGHSASKPE